MSTQQFSNVSSAHHLHGLSGVSSTMVGGDGSSRLTGVGKGVVTSRPSWSQSQSSNVTDLPSFSQSSDLNACAAALGGTFIIQQNSTTQFLDSCAVTQAPIGARATHLRQPTELIQPSPASPHRMDSRLSLSAGAPLMSMSPPTWTSAQRMAVSDSTPSAPPHGCAEQPCGSTVLHVVGPAGEDLYCVPARYSSPTPWLHSSGGAASQPSSMQLLHVMPPPPATTSAGSTAPAATPSLLVSPMLPWQHQHSQQQQQQQQQYQQPSAKGSAGGGIHATPPSPLMMPDALTEEDEFEYEPYTAHTLAHRRIGSLDRVYCALHGKDRSAQNMVLVRSKRTNEIHWRCKHSCHCKAHNPDRGEALDGFPSATRGAMSGAFVHPQPYEALGTGAEVPMPMPTPASVWNAPSGMSHYTLIPPTSSTTPPEMPPPSPQFVSYTPHHDTAPCLNPVVLRAAPPHGAVPRDASEASPVYYQLYTRPDQLPPVILQRSPYHEQHLPRVPAPLPGDVCGIPYHVQHIYHASFHMQ